MERTSKFIILVLISFLLIILIALILFYNAYAIQQEEFNQRLELIKTNTITKTIVVEQKADNEIQKVMIENPKLSKELNNTKKQITGDIKDLRNDLKDDINDLQKDVRRLNRRIVALETGGGY